MIAKKSLVVVLAVTLALVLNLNLLWAHDLDLNTSHNIGIADRAWATTGDVDGDGDIDIIGMQNSDGSDIYYWPNNGSGTFGDSILIFDNNDYGPPERVIMDDFNRDGDMDFVVSWCPSQTNATLRDRVQFLRNTGTTWVTENIIYTDTPNNVHFQGAFDVRAVDIDSDNDLDVVACAIFDNKISWFENNGGTPNITWTEHIIGSGTLNYEHPRSICPSDIDADNDIDIVCAILGEDDVIWLENDGSENFTRNVVDNDLEQALDVAVADIDNDGHLDIVASNRGNNVGGIDGATASTVWYKNENDAQPFSDASPDTISSRCGRTIAFADMDGENGIDIVFATGNTDRLIWVENNLNTPFTFTEHSFATVDGAFSTSIADLDDDSDYDIVAGMRGGDRIDWWEHRYVQTNVFKASTTDDLPRISWFSTYLVPDELDADSVFGNINDLAQVIDNDNNIYNGRVDEIGDIDITDGFRMNTQTITNSSWIIVGDKIDPATEYYITSAYEGCYIGYPYDYEIAITQALANLDSLLIVHNSNGGAYIPDYNINTIGNMKPGQGYRVTSLLADTFTYYTQLIAPKSLPSSEVWEIAKVEDAPEPTGMPYTVLVYMSDGLKKHKTHFIELYDKELMVGKAQVMHDKPLTPVTAWGKNESVDLDGYDRGNDIIVKIIAEDGSVIQTKQISDKQLFGEGLFAEITLDTDTDPETSLVPNDFNVSSGYPNPFNPSITIPFSIPANGEVSVQVYNILGEKVYSSFKDYNAGNHQIVLNSNSQKFAWSSGIYIVKVNYQGLAKTQKIILMK